MIICSSPKKEGELPSSWHETTKNAWMVFNAKVKHIEQNRKKKIKWRLEPKVIEYKSKFNIIND